MSSLIKNINQLWSTTAFLSPELRLYAEKTLLGETRKGVMAMSLLLLALIISALPVYFQLNLHSIYLYTYLLVAALSLHTYFSSKKINDINVLYLLGITLLTISATAFVSIAHQSNSFSVLLFANIVLLFMAVPLVPWGIREASIAILIIYVLLTLSTGGMTHRFGTDTLIILQFFMIASAMTSLLLVARSVRVRKDDLVVRFDLEQAHTRLYKLSNTDPLTRAWNRRFLPIAIDLLIKDYKENYVTLNYFLFDIDDFKSLNDNYGHDYGDKVLKCFGDNFNKKLSSNGYFIRLGGDEFALLLIHEIPTKFVDQICAQIINDCNAIDDKISGKVGISYGLATAMLNKDVSLETLYIEADKSMYNNKNAGKSVHGNVSSLNIVHENKENESAVSTVNQ
jgi:diguanylate cyclase (GGDEF)-like protein